MAKATGMGGPDGRTNGRDFGNPESRPGLLLAQVRELYERAAYTHKTHEKQSDICYRKYWWQRRGLQSH